MANAYKCDRCGVFFTEDEFNGERPRYNIMDRETDNFIYPSLGDRAHLCPSCSKKLHEWMENKPTTHTVYLKDPADLYINIHHPYPGGTKTVVKEKKRWWQRK